MSKPEEMATVSLYPKRNAFYRTFALWYFLVLMVLWNIAGHTFLGFEQAWAAPFVAVLTAVAVQLLLEWIDARSEARTPRFAKGFASFFHFLPPPMISGFACAMLLYPNDRLWPLVFAATFSIASKVLFRVPLADGKWTHFMNPSNVGIIATLLLFPSVGQAPPYHFTENLEGVAHWILPVGIMATGIVVHGFATGRLPLCLAWLITFVAQGVVRAWWFGDWEFWYVPLTPMTSAGFILFTLYMIPDPATTPLARSRQIVFGMSVAIAYAFFQVNHIVYGLFFALATVSLCRGIGIMMLFRPKENPPTEPSVVAETRALSAPNHKKKPANKRLQSTQVR
jgi:enediyne biosynthesis protein E5